MNKQGLVVVYTGNGKGKTTAAMGLAMRAVGQGLRVSIIQFIKGSWHCGEHDSAKKLGIEMIQMGEGFTWKTEKSKNIEMAQEAFELSCEYVHSGRYDMVILDEINNVVKYQMLSVESLLELISKKPKNLHLVLTGRNAHEKVIMEADLVTEMKEIKHPFNKGIKAQQGIEF